MKLIQRLGFYLGGFAVGLVFLMFFFSGKRTQCAYGPEARVLKNIREKPIIFSEEIKSQLNHKGADSLVIQQILQHGDVDFSRSQTKLDSCRTYVVEGFVKEAPITLTFANCDYKAEIISVE